MVFFKIKNLGPRGSRAKLCHLPLFVKLKPDTILQRKTALCLTQKLPDFDLSTQMNRCHDIDLLVIELLCVILRRIASALDLDLTAESNVNSIEPSILYLGDSILPPTNASATIVETLRCPRTCTTCPPAHRSLQHFNINTSSAALYRTSRSSNALIGASSNVANSPPAVHPLFPLLFKSRIAPSGLRGVGAQAPDVAQYVDGRQIHRPVIGHSVDDGHRNKLCDNQERSQRGQ